MILTAAKFKVRFPEFTDSDERIDVFINDATVCFDVCRWANLYEIGLSNFVAHNLALSNKRIADSLSASVSGGASIANGVVQSERVGDVAVTYAVNSSGGKTDPTENPYMKTSYGQEYYRLSRMVGIGAVSV